MNEYTPDQMDDLLAMVHAVGLRTSRGDAAQMAADIDRMAKAVDERLTDYTRALLDAWLMPIITADLTAASKDGA